MILLAISFIAGVLTALAPCVLPLLPVIVGGSIAQGTRNRAYTISISLGISVILFTFLLKASTVFINVPQSFWSGLSGTILILFGIIMVFPRLWDSLGFVNLMNRSSNQLLATGYQKNSFWGDVIMGAALGPVFSSCSPTYFVILATVLPASFAMGFADLAAYALGLSGFLLLIALAGQKLVDRLGVAIEPTGWFRRGIGILFLIIGLAVFTGAEARAEAWLLNNGFDLTGIEQKLLQANMPPPSPQCASGQCPGTSAPQNFPDSTSSPQAGATSTANSTPVSPQLAVILAHKAAMYPKAPELVKPDGYINTPPLPSGQAGPITIGQFKGKDVVLIDIWTYSCINCQRTLPYIKAWYDKYHDKGLEIISVHTPEFAFEHVYKNVQDAVMSFGIKYPVVLDNEYATWNAFGNEFWPRKYLIDIDGYIVYDHAGEGNYDETEKAIQSALAERDQRLGISATMPTVTTAPAGAVPDSDLSKINSPETYFGSARNQYLTNGTQGQVGDQTLTIPATLTGNSLYLGGTWNFQQEYATTKTAGAQIKFMYNSKSVYFVAAADQSVKIKVTRDGGLQLGAARGADVDANGEATIQENRLYKLIEDTDYGVHTIEIQVENPGLQAYTFTFG